MMIKEFNNKSSDERGYDMKINNKGISAVVATVLIILITVAAVTIIWAAIIPLIQGQLDTTTSCLTAQTEIILGSDFTCIEPSGSILVQIKAGASSVSLSDVQVILYEGGNSNSTRIVSLEAYDSDDLPSANSAKVFNITLGNVTAMGFTSPDRVQLAPVVSEGNTQQICPAGQILDLRDC